MSGHGTVISGGDAEGDCELYISDSGKSDRYDEYEISKAINLTKGPVAPGEVVRTEWDNGHNQVVATAQAKRAIGNVSADGKSFEVTNAGDSGWSG